MVPGTSRVVLICMSSFLALGPAITLPIYADDGLLGHWSFDEGQGDVAIDRSGHDNDGEIAGARWVRGKFGTALRFNGHSAYVTVPEIAGLDGAEEMTLEAWVFWESGGKYPNIVTGGRWSPGGFLLFVNDRQCSFRMGRPGYSATKAPKQWCEIGAPLVAPFTLSKWYHIAVSFKRPMIKTYVDGQVVGSSSWEYPVGYQGDLVFGRWGGTTSHQGLIDEIKLYKRCLDANEIAADYRATLVGRNSTAGDDVAYKVVPRRSQLASAEAVFENDFAKLAISSRGRCAALIDRRTGKDHLLHTTPLVTIRRGDVTYQRAKCKLVDNQLILQFPKAETTVTVRVEAKGKYFTFHVESVSKPNIDELTFVNLDLQPCQRVNSMSGLASDEQFAVCLRALNLETNVKVSGESPKLTAASFATYGLEQGSAALVACPTPQLIGILREVVRNERLPYSALGGPFSLVAEENRGSYVFARVSEDDVDAWIELALRGGIQTVHLSGWQQSLGHYAPRKDLYPRGLAGLKAVTDRLHAAGLRVGIHTLTGCISTNDPWVCPVPDPRLATDGAYTLATNIGVEASDVLTAEPPGDHPTIWAYSSRGNCIRIDDELIQYSGLSTKPSFGFLHCRRGAFGTRVASHTKGTAVQHMYTRYGGFVADEHTSLVDDVADRIAEVYNTCELDQIYMDGAEAERGWYGVARMRHAIYTRLERPALVEASCWDHHSWPFHSRVGAWDHPRWGLKRFADDHLRAIENYRRQYLLEGQLGWWVILGPSRDWNMEMPDEIEYLSVKALAHDVPLSFQTVVAAGTPPNARQDEYLTMVGQCERLRLADYFSETVKRTLREERKEFSLTQAIDGQWQFEPTDYLEHKVLGDMDDSRSWHVTNRFATQPLRMRIEALHVAYPFADPRSLLLAEYSTKNEFTVSGSATGVRSSLVQSTAVPPWPSTADTEEKPAITLRFQARNDGDSPVGAWARIKKDFEPVIDLTSYDALGVWVHGDGQGALLNLQLTNLPEYFHTFDDHYIKLDFTGWRYFELLMRERDAAAYHDYSWPYGAHTALHRSPLVRQAVSRVTIYLNNLSPGSETTCYLGPIKALRTRKSVLHNPSLRLANQQIVFPVDLDSGMYIEYESPENCRVYDPHGNLLRWVRPTGAAPTLMTGANTLAFTCQDQQEHGTQGFRTRAAITVITHGAPLRGQRPATEIDWSLLQREYEPPRTIVSLDGNQNRWAVLCRPDQPYADVELELRVEQVGNNTEAFNSRSAVALEDFEQKDEPNGAASHAATLYRYDSQPTATGCSPKVTQSLTRCSDIVKRGDASACFKATSQRDDHGGWAVKTKVFAHPMDLSRHARIGFWLHGDAGMQQFKLQLRDASGGWQDMYTRVDFRGWRFCQFALGGPNLKDLRKITGLNIYFNSIPAGKTVECRVDEIRVFGPPEPLRNPTLSIAGKTVRFPVAMNAGDRLLIRNGQARWLEGKGKESAPIKMVPTLPRLRPGMNSILFSLPENGPRQFRVRVSLVKKYPKPVVDSATSKMPQQEKP